MDGVNFDLDTLRCFISFAEKRNFTHAAAELHISQPALFVKIQGLAQQLGVPVYRKVGRSLELTAEGAVFERFSRQFLRQAAECLNELQGSLGAAPVVLAAGEGSYLYLLGDAIREFTRAPHELQLVTANREGVIDAVLQGRADLGVASLETIPPGCKATVFKEVQQLLVMPADHSLAIKKKVALKDFEGLDLIVPPADRPHRQYLSMALQSKGVNWSVAVEASGWELMLKFVQMGIGLAVVNSMCTIPRGLVGRPVIELPDIPYHLFHLKGHCKTGPAAELKRKILH